MFLPSSCSNRHHHRHQHHPWRPDLSSQWMSSDVKPPLYSYRTSASIEEWYQSLFINRTTSLAGDKGSCWHALDQRRPLRRSGYLMWCLECDASEIGLGVRYKGHGQVSYCSRDFIYGIMVHQKEKRKKRHTHTYLPREITASQLEYIYHNNLDQLRMSVSLRNLLPGYSLLM